MMVDGIREPFDRLAELEREQRHMLSVVAVIIRKYGEDNGQGHKVVRISDAELERVTAEPPTLVRWDDPATAEIVYGVRP